MKMTPKELHALFTKMCQFDQTLGLDLHINQEGHLEYELLVDEKHISRPGISHGGAVAGMMDAVLGVTALERAVGQGQLCSTVEFKINYLQPAKVGDRLKGCAKVDFIGKSLVVTSGEIRGRNSLVAKGQGTFNLYPLDDKNLKSLIP